MADLAPIKSLVSTRGSSSGQAKPTSAPERAGNARFVAIDYARKLTVAPNGARITSTEKNILLHLALAFNAEIGVAWPSIDSLAKDACTCVRHCRRNLASLERKRVIQRVPMRREGTGGQTSNEYFFPELGSPLQTPEAKARRLEIQRVSRTPMTRTTRTRGQTRPKAADTSSRPARTNVTQGPGHQRPPIESLGESVRGSLNERESGTLKTLAATQGNIKIAKCTAEHSGEKDNVFSNLEIARVAWESVLQRVREENGAKDFRSYRFQDVRVSAVQVHSGASLTIELRSPDPDKLILGIQTHQETIGRALRRFYGCEVKLSCLEENTLADLSSAQNRAASLPPR